MRLSSKMNDEWNKMGAGEYKSHFLYITMATWFAQQNLDNFAKLFYKYADEELIHARKVINFITANEGKVNLPLMNELNDLSYDFTSLEEVFNKGLEREEFVTTAYNELKGLARALKDETSALYCDWFLTEQIEEEEKMRRLISLFKIGTSNSVVGTMESCLEHIA